MIYYITKFLSLVIFKLFYNLKIYGTENIPKKGPYLVCTNHCSFFDPLVICDAIPQRVYWLAIKDLYKIQSLSIFLMLVKCIPVNGAIKEALVALRKNKIIGIFPEGRRTYDGKLMKKGKKGAAILAMRSGVPVLPAWISGTYEAYSRRAKFPKLNPISIRFGKPLKFSVHNEETIDEQVVSETTAEIMRTIAELQNKLC